MIRVLVVDDSITVRQRLIEIISATEGFEVVGEAGNGKRAIELAAALKPDVITLDIVMPEMSGLAATEEIMARTPTPILIVSSSFNRGELFDTYSALSAGAVDVLEKPNVNESGWEGRFLGAVRLVSKIKVITHPRNRLGALGRARGVAPTLPLPPAREDPSIGRPIDLVAIGASTGGPGALATVLGSIASPYALPILLVLHIDPQFAGAFAEWLGAQTRHSVKPAVDGEALEALAGEVRLAPPNAHMIVAGKRLRLVATPPRNHCRPSVDVLFESVAMEHGPKVAACLLTGMGRDGAAGLLAIRKAGGVTIAQDEATSVIYGMPREAVACGAVERELPLPEIGHALEMLRRRRAP